MHKGKTIHQSNEATVVDCKTCGFAHVNPLPSQSDLNEFYEKRFYQNVKTSYFTDYERDQDWWTVNYQWLIDDLLANYKRPKGDGPIELLDIGSGPGLFLEIASQKGINAMGIEPSKEAYEYSTKKYKRHVVNTTLEQMSDAKNKFDIIHSSLVLEHILDPLKFVKKSKSMLKKNGLLCIIVPNDFNPIQKINIQLGRPEWWVSPYEHLNYFNRTSLKRLFQKAGLDVVYENVTFPIDLFLLMDKNYLSDPSMGKECHAMRKAFEFNMNKTGNEKFKETLYKAFSKINVGRELVIMGKK